MTKKKTTIWRAFGKDMRASSCPVCHHRLDAYQVNALDKDLAVTAPPPDAGDITLCAYCQTILIYDAAHQLRVLSEPELAIFRARNPALAKGMDIQRERLIQHAKKDAH